MRTLAVLLRFDMKRRVKDGFLIGYNVIFPIVLILLLGYLLSGGYGAKMSGYHYYTFVMLPFCIAMAIITAAYAGKDEAYKKTAPRLLIAPIQTKHIVVSKLLSCSLIVSVCNLVVLLFAIIVFRLPVGQNFLIIFLLLMAETFCVCAIGLLVGLGMKNFIVIKNLLNIPICVAGVLAGCFFPFGSMNKVLDFFIRLSPLTWINRGIFLSVYDKDIRLAVQMTIILFVFGSIITIAAILKFRKEEFIHGDIPGYQ